ncbi:IgGFc-binding protein [Pseudenhygromyxa sp. WMMC2535]|uniref:IgGFc-binding protein n=1 Tax=Pseudenhygromyxa sp. WMMC2535 TaxID=2712867 RepID=UPI0015541936|nr:IgGFc-binding protein [Pseudenhygromyxa sp. WMMC2535]NVB38261.1 IgGFc-binding protein [Pseudenhygromyxa sp. WMMC2535]
MKTSWIRAAVAGVAVASTLGACQGEGEANDEAEQDSGSEDACILGSLGCACVEGECLGDLVCEDQLCAEPSDLDSSSGEDSSSDDADTQTSEGSSSDGESSGESSESSESSTDTDSDSGEDEGTTTGGPDNTCDNPDGAFGCEFYALKLPSREPFFDDWAMQVVVGNPGPEDAEVVVERRIEGAWTNVAGPLPVAAEDLYSFYFYGSEDTVPLGLSAGYTYRITSSTPVVAHQYVPHDAIHGGGAISLLPTALWRDEYQAFNGPSSPTPYVTVVASVDDTTLTIDPPTVTKQAPQVPQTSSPFQILMDAGEAVRLKTHYDNQTLNGAEISTDAAHPVGVYVGGYATTQTAHYEEQLLPLEFAGTFHLAVTAGSNNDNDSSDSAHRLWGLVDTTFMAQAAPGTFLNPSASGTLDAGQYRLINASSFDLEQVTIGYPAGTELSVDGAPLSNLLYAASEFAPGWWVARFAPAPGMHVLEADQPVTVVFGSERVSMYAGVAHE